VVLELMSTINTMSKGGDFVSCANPEILNSRTLRKLLKNLII
jgi:hypothetical protein